MMSLNKFKDLLQFWTYGPKWLNTADSDWPVNELNYLSGAKKQTIQSNVAKDKREGEREREGGRDDNIPLIDYISP